MWRDVIVFILIWKINRNGNGNIEDILVKNMTNLDKYGNNSNNVFYEKQSDLIWATESEEYVLDHVYIKCKQTLESSKDSVR